MKVLLVDQIAKVNYKYSFSLAQALMALGQDVSMAIDQKKEDEGCLCPKYNWFITDEKNISKLAKAFNYLWSYEQIRRLVKKEHYDVVHVQWFQLSPLDYLYLKMIKAMRKVKLVVTVHDILPFNERFYDKAFHGKIYALADEIIVQADNNVQRFGELFPDDKHKVYCIPHGHFLDYADFCDKQEARRKLDIPEGKRVFLFFGQIKKVKGVGVLLESFARICKEHPDYYLIIAGSVWKDDFSSYQEIIDRTGIADQVRLEIRYIDDAEIGSFYSAADICVLPYLDVYQSGVVQLCYAYKKPVIATDLAAFQEVVLDGRSGLLCKVNDVDGLAAKMIELGEQPELFDGMGSCGYQYIKEKYSWDRIAEKVSEIYEAPAKDALKENR